VTVNEIFGGVKPWDSYDCGQVREPLGYLLFQSSNQQYQRITGCCSRSVGALAVTLWLF